MKQVYVFLFLLVNGAISYSQAPEIEWQNTIGGDLSDILQSVEQTLDSGFILGGISTSNI